MTDTAAPVTHRLGEFVYDIEGGLGVPRSRNNSVALIAWAVAEGGATKNSAAFNPFNTTKRYGDSRSINRVGVQAYASYADGVAATLATIKLPRYATIRSRLAADAPPLSTAAAIAGSGWGTSSLVIASVAPVSAALDRYAALSIGQDRAPRPSTIDSIALGIGDPVAGAVAGATKGITSIGDLLSTPHLAVRTIEVIGGIILGVIGLGLLARDLGVSVPLPGPLGVLTR